MKIVALRESTPNETRIPLTPQAAEKLVSLGAEVLVERGLGTELGFSEAAFDKAGATQISDVQAAIGGADVVVHLNKPTPEDIDQLREGTVLISFLDPFSHPESIAQLAKRGISSLCMELIPRTSYAQKMDALSSQASLAGYAAVIMAADRIHKAFPMMSTPAGTIPPARVLIIGAGVAGLQSIATAKRLGARVEAYDTRPVVAEQVRSLGAKFVQLEVGDSGQTEQGYAKELSAAQLERQQQQLAKYCANADVVITTAQVFGRPAPRIVSAAMVAGMRSGSVIVDLAASTGGNVAGTVPGEEVTVNGVLMVGLNNFPGEVARDASQMYASNITNLIAHLWNKDAARLELDTSDAIVASVLLTYGGEIRDERIRKLLEDVI